MYVDSIINLAEEWLGDKESDGSFKHIIDIYNSYSPHPRNYKMTYNDPWCATFISALAIKLGYTSIIPVECSCYYMMMKAKDMGIWVEDDNHVPKAGDIIMYCWSDNGIGDNTGHPNHVGIVESVVGDSITVIEGNKEDKVDIRNVKVGQKYIRGYICPHYTSLADLTCIGYANAAIDVIKGKYGNSPERETRLAKMGYSYSKVQKIVNAILS